MSSNSSGVVSAPVLPTGPEPPATLTRMSMRPNLSAAFSAACSQSSRLGQVARHHDGLRSPAAHLRRDRFDRRGISSGEHQMSALTRKCPGDGRTHPLGRPGDDRDPPLKHQVHCFQFPALMIPGEGPRLKGGAGRHAQNNFLGRSAAGGRNSAVKISSTFGVRGRLFASTRMSIDFFSRSGSMLPRPILAISG